MRRQAKKFAKGSPSDGSALILTVVLTSMLAIMGVLFVMMARVNQIATSGISESRELDSAIETVIAKISEELVLDVPGVSATNPDYYDYPDSNDEWLASLEPHQDGNDYKWRQISDVYEKLGSVELTAEIIPDYQDATAVSTSSDADADGDGVADSKWVELAEITSSKGKPIYAAIRIVDNGGMINVNTAYKFDPTESLERIDGSSQMQINLAALAERGANGFPATAAAKLQDWRCGTEPNNDLSLYEQNVVWRYSNPSGAYTPFDIGDELKLRNRYILNYNLMTSRIEELWERAYDGGLDVPRTEPSKLRDDPNYWFWKANNSSSDANQYDYRHISTTYNMDRIIRPDGGRMLNINHDDPNVNVIYNAIRAGLIDGGITDPNSPAAQITVNLIDFRDNDSNVTSINVGGSTYYGFERPCVYISELVHKFVTDANISVRPAGYVYRSYGIELHKPYSEDDYPEPNQWRLSIEDYGAFPVNWSGTQSFHVMSFEHPDALLDVNWGELDPNITPSKDIIRELRPGTIVFTANKIISLERLVGSDWIAVDSVRVPFSQPGSDWLERDGETHSYQRDITLHKCIRRLWDESLSMEDFGTLGGRNAYTDPNNEEVIQAHPANEDFTNVGEIGMVFVKSAYSEGPNAIGPTDTEATARINLAESRYQSLFQYLTVFDPYYFHLWDPNYISEKRIKGRININTAPWFVIAQLPWMQYQDGNSVPFERAKAICNERDEPLQQGFWNIGELMLVEEMRLSADGKNNWNGDTPKGPDITYDTAQDDFEERDLIFTRISNLVTVRSDVFTAYILVRIGTDGPQKRVIAILDRSDVYSPTDRVKIVAVHPVADPR